MHSPRLAVVGGDAREWHAACALRDAGFDVLYVGPQPVRGTVHPGSPTMRRSLPDALPGCQAVIGPVRGLPEADVPALAATLAGEEHPPRVVIAGRLPGELVQACRERGVAAVDLLTRDEFAIANAVPTAEGAIVEALQAADVTLMGSRAVVIGYGRTGRVLADRLRALGARTAVASRDAGRRAEAQALGLEAVGLEELPRVLATADFVFNTAPALVLDAVRLRHCQPGAVIVDIASPPGGTDFQAAAAMGLTTRWPLGIPGRQAPRSAGRIVAAAVRTILAEHGLAAVAPGGGRS